MCATLIIFILSNIFGSDMAPGSGRQLGLRIRMLKGRYSEYNLKLSHTLASLHLNVTLISITIGKSPT